MEVVDEDFDGIVLRLLMKLLESLDLAGLVGQLETLESLAGARRVGTHLEEEERDFVGVSEDFFPFLVGEEILADGLVYDGVGEHGKLGFVDEEFGD